MPTLSPQEVTQLLADWGKGDRSALDKLFPLVQLGTPAHRSTPDEPGTPRSHVPGNRTRQRSIPETRGSAGI